MKNEERDAAAVELHGDDVEARKRAASLLGRARSERKTIANREKAKKPRNRPVRPLAEIECTCGAGMSLQGHGSRCLRGRAIKRRQEKGQPLE